MMPTVKLYYWKSKNQPEGYGNFGDMLSPILARVLLQCEPVRADGAECGLTIVGSILQRFKPEWTGTVLGSGMLFPNHPLDLSRATVRALRGALTAARSRARGEYALGDPGLLVPFLVDRPEPQWEVGVVPHWSDHELAARFPEAHVISPVCTKPLDVVREIASCRRVVASSLHGLITADAFGIPAQAEPFHRMAGEGGDYKFRDYATTVGVEHVFGEERVASATAVEATQRDLLAAFDAVKGDLQ